jgi:hypothetical protein
MEWKKIRSGTSYDGASMCATFISPALAISAQGCFKITLNIFIYHFI